MKETTKHFACGACGQLIKEVNYRLINAQKEAKECKHDHLWGSDHGVLCRKCGQLKPDFYQPQPQEKGSVQNVLTPQPSSDWEKVSALLKEFNNSYTDFYVDFPELEKRIHLLLTQARKEAKEECEKVHGKFTHINAMGEEIKLNNL